MTSRDKPNEPRWLTQGDSERGEFTAAQELAQCKAKHQQSLDDAYETGPCPACSGDGSSYDSQGWEVGACHTCVGLKRVPLTYEAWRAWIADGFAGSVGSAIDALTKALESNSETLEPDTEMVERAHEAVQAAEASAGAWRMRVEKGTV